MGKLLNGFCLELGRMLLVFLVLGKFWEIVFIKGFLMIFVFFYRGWRMRIIIFFLFMVMIILMIWSLSWFWRSFFRWKVGWLGFFWWWFIVSFVFSVFWVTVWWSLLLFLRWRRLWILFGFLIWSWRIFCLTFFFRFILFTSLWIIIGFLGRLCVRLVIFCLFIICILAFFCLLLLVSIVVFLCFFSFGFRIIVVFGWRIRFAWWFGFWFFFWVFYFSFFGI